MRKLRTLSVVSFLIGSTAALAAPDATQLAVWANEAIVATYSYNYKDYLTRQSEIAHYFSADGWTAYSTALNASQLPETIQKNAYFVSAVAALPPEIKATGSNQWQASMPLLVIYKNPQYQQKQILQVTINFSAAPVGQGVRGLAINGLQSKVTQPPCECQTPSPQDNSSTKTSDVQQLPNVKQAGAVKGQ